MSTPKYKQLVFIGPPASGKGTFCARTCASFGMVHISTGDLLRDEMKRGSDIGRQCKKFVNAGKLVPDEFIVSMVKQKLESAECRARGWALDGFPRTAAQAAKLCGFIDVRRTLLIQLSVPDEVVINRITNRRIDPVTNKVYHLINKPPPNDEIRSRLVRREDDTKSKVTKRLNTYYEHLNAITAELVDRQHMPRVQVSPPPRDPDNPEHITQSIGAALRRGRL